MKIDEKSTTTTETRPKRRRGEPRRLKIFLPDASPFLLPLAAFLPPFTAAGVPPFKQFSNIFLISS